VPAAEPIFLHSLFRAAGALLLSRFRALGLRLTCYREPFNEALIVLNDPKRHQKLLESRPCAAQGSVSRARPEFYEYWVCRQPLSGLFRDRFAYQQYFVGDSGQLPPQQALYLSTLLTHAAGRPVLQCCRSSGRLAALRRQYGGAHVYVWREPRAQWWSYRAAGYFDAANQRIYRANHLPAALGRVGAAVGAAAGEPSHLRPRESYLLFYALWLDAWLRACAHAQLSIGLDAVGSAAAEATRCARQLSELVGCPLDLSAVRATGMVFAAEEDAFYAQIERSVHEAFVADGQVTAGELQGAIDAAYAARRCHERRGRDRTAEPKLRQAALDMMDRLASQEEAARQWSARHVAARIGAYWRSFRLRPATGSADPPSAPDTAGEDLRVTAQPGTLR